MSFRLSARALALVAGASLVFGATTVAVPAFADDAPVDPVATSTPDAAASSTTVDYTGRVTRIADETTAGPDVELFRVVGSGYLRVDLSHLKLGGSVLADVTLRFAVPAGLALSVDPATSFQQLADYSSTAAPLVATEKVEVAVGPRTKALVNQTPESSATHRIFAVLVTPSDDVDTSAAANQTVAKVKTSVAHADSFWSAQSGGSVHFVLTGTTGWYKSTASCKTDAGATQLWNEASTIAKNQLGYQDAWNTHLALFFPSNTDCGGAIGLGTIGWSVNAGGQVWVVGTDAPVEQATLTHELGHNMSFGHADWAECSASDPHPGFFGTDGCPINNYGDITDAMGYGIDGNSGGAVSSPNAIRSGLWPSTAYVYAPKTAATGVSYTLNAVSSHAGLRSVVVEDSDGVDYFVEFRNQTGEDAAVSTWGCDPSDACVSSTPDVRILRLEQTSLSGYYFRGVPGDDAYLIGHTVAGVDEPGWGVGETFHGEGTGAISISVTAIGTSTATVKVVRSASSVHERTGVHLLDAEPGRPAAGRRHLDRDARPDWTPTATRSSGSVTASRSPARPGRTTRSAPPTWVGTSESGSRGPWAPATRRRRTRPIRSTTATDR